MYHPAFFQNILAAWSKHPDDQEFCYLDGPKRLTVEQAHEEIRQRELEVENYSRILLFITGSVLRMDILPKSRVGLAFRGFF